MFGHPKTHGDLLPRQIDHRADNRLSQIGEMVAHFHYRQHTENIGGGNAEQGSVLKLAQAVDKLFFVILRQAQ